MTNTKKTEVIQGHWVLAKMRKKVLRPGGKKLSKKLISGLNINSKDDIVEFAPGLGFTAMLTLKNNPKSYTGIELNKKAASTLRKKITGNNRQIILENATKVTSKSSSATKVFGEAMLTMQADNRKSQIINQAYRILKSKGLYSIHELCSTPNNIPKELKVKIQKELSNIIKVNARPLTVNEWKELLKKEGFEIVNTYTHPMHLLKPNRIINDEGFFRTLKIAFNILTHPQREKYDIFYEKTFKKISNVPQCSRNYC